eukprot:1142435-Pelagomonas_calceolata.AAC.2
MAGLQSSVEDRAQGAAAEAALMAGQVAALQEALKVGLWAKRGLCTLSLLLSAGAGGKGAKTHWQFMSLKIPRPVSRTPSPRLQELYALSLEAYCHVFRSSTPWHSLQQARKAKAQKL